MTSFLGYLCNLYALLFKALQRVTVYSFAKLPQELKHPELKSGNKRTIKRMMKMSPNPPKPPKPVLAAATAVPCLDSNDIADSPLICFVLQYHHILV
jgi:hypothetical protein